MGSMERQLRRRQEQAAPKTANAVDLEQFKGGDKATQQEVANRMLQQGGWMCSCGNRFKAEAIIAVGQNLGRYPAAQMTPQGPRTTIEDGAQTITQTFCSERCAHYQRALKDGLEVPEDSGMARPKVMAIRLVPPTVWLDGPERGNGEWDGSVLLGDAA